VGERRATYSEFRPGHRFEEARLVGEGFLVDVPFVVARSDLEVDGFGVAGVWFGLWLEEVRDLGVVITVFGAGAGVGFASCASSPGHGVKS
jgi:hypothetical protein